MMTASALHAVLATLAHASVPAWLDGGWGVDALLGFQSRRHSDLDLVVSLDLLEVAIDALGHDGYAITEDERPTRVALQTADLRAVDLHLVTFRDDGSGIQKIQDGSTFRYAAEGFTGTGSVANQAVACLTLEVQIECHLGYAPEADDRADMRALARKFGIALPPPYRE